MIITGGGVRAVDDVALVVATVVQEINRLSAPQWRTSKSNYFRM